MADDGVPADANGHDGGAAKPPRVHRGRYAKFNGGMDVLLLEALRSHNPFTAKHGTRLQMWQSIAEIVGEELFKNPEAYSWHTCRDRVTALMKMYTDGKHDKLFKHGTAEENARKETILREINTALARKNHKMAMRVPLTPVASTALLADRGKPAASGQKRRKLADGSVEAVAGGSHLSDAYVDGDAFRARVLALIESKIQFDMDQRAKETELREQEFELQKRFLEYLQSK